MGSSNRDPNGVCPKTDRDSCPPGHQLRRCKPGDGDGFYCQMCSDKTFQPDETWARDNCKTRRDCNKPKMYYKDKGSTTRNANCGCTEGYHLPSATDQRHCHPHSECKKGYAPKPYGGCESCYDKGMYSDSVSRIHACKPLTNCEKQNRCTLTHSNGEYDNICGPKVKDLSNCSELESESSIADILKIAVPAGIVAVLLIFFFLLFFARRQKYHRKSPKKTLTDEEKEELRINVIKGSDRDPALCKRVLTTSCSFVEERIDRQIWDLARELFRQHHIAGKYELIVDKYKESQPKYTVNGYLVEWRQWRGDCKDAVSELFHSLRHVKREDIINEICQCYRYDVEISEDGQKQTNKNSFKDECNFIFFPCCYDQKEKTSPPSKNCSGPTVVVEADPGEAGTKLLAYPSDDVDDNEGGDCGEKVAPGVIFRTHPSPSAPDLDDMPSHLPSFPNVDNVKFNRQYSSPVQATS